MKKRIYWCMILLSSLSILLVSAVLCAVFYKQFTTQVQADLRQRIQIFTNNTAQTALVELVDIDPLDVRVTLLSPEGIVEYDNMVAVYPLENHLGREEVDEALSFGEGESNRFSQTLNSRTYYYAIRLEDGAVLRIAKTVDTMWNMFVGALPLIVAVVLIFVAVSYFLAKRLAEKVIKPLKEMDPEKETPAVYDELTPFVRTITHHREQIATREEELRQRSETTSVIMDNMSEGVVMLDTKGKILTLNKSATKIFDIDTDIEGRNILELWRDADFFQNVRAALDGQRKEMNYEKYAKQYRMILSPVADSGVIILLLDITENLRADRMRREFSANVSHELKTPLTSIYGNAEMLYEGVVEENDKREFYRRIKNEASRLISLIEDIIMLSRLDEGNMSKTAEQISLKAVAEECVQELMQKAEQHQVSVSVEGNASIVANKTMMHEMFYNLIENAIKYNHPDGSVRVLISQTQERTHIEVADNGIGMSKEDQERVFERFYRADKSRSKESGGTGLGLAIVKHIVLTHGGTIRVTCEPGKDTRFLIEL